MDHVPDGPRSPAEEFDDLKAVGLFHLGTVPLAKVVI